VCSNNACGLPLPTRRIIYYVRFIGTNGKRQWRSLGEVSREFAEQQSAELVRSANEHRSGDWRDPWTVTLAQIADKYGAHVQAQRTARYCKATRRFLDRLIGEWGAGCRMSSISIHEVRELQDKLCREGKKPSTVNRYMAAGSAAWNWCLPDTPNPFARLKTLPEKNGRTEDLTPEQRTRLLEIAQRISQTLYEMILVSLATGLRRDEVCNLRRDWIDLQVGKGAVIQKGNSWRPVFFPESVVKVLANIPPDEKGSPYFWTNPRTGKPYKEGLRKRWERIRKEAGLGDFRWHGLRHAAGCEAYALTGSLKAVKEFLGHKDLKTTERYAIVRSEALRAIADAIDPLSESLVALTVAPKKKRSK